jgi:hypothetical protein
MDRLIHLSNIEISKLDISDQIVIAAVMVSLKENKQRFSLEELVTSHFSPTTELNIRLIEHLIALELVMICNINKKSEYTYKLKVLNDEPTLKLLFNSIKESNYSDNPLIKNLIFEVLSA